LGDEVKCTVRFGQQESAGKALLETNEVIFRGDFRLKIPLRAMKSVKAAGGELHIEFPEGKAIFFLGPQAEKWAHKILHPKTVMEKLGVEENQNISVVGVADQDFLKQLKERTGKLSTGKAAKGSDAIFLGAEAQKDLTRIKTLVKSLKKDDGLWIVYPKGQKHITEADVIAAGRKAGLKDVKVVGFSATHTALKFVIPLSAR
jgi:hypothetical protein